LTKVKGKTKLLISFLLLYALDPMNYGFVFGYLACLMVVSHPFVLKSQFDKVASSLFLFSVVYAIFYALNPGLGAQFIVIYALIPTTLYISGKILAKEIGNENKIFWLLIVVGFVFSLPGALSILMDIATYGFVKVKRDVPNIWSGDLQSATNMAAGFALNMCIPAFLVIRGQQLRKKGRLILLVTIYVISILCVLRLGSRTQIALSLFTLLVAIFYKMGKQNAKKNIGLFALIFIGFNLGVSYLSLDTDSELLSAYADRADSKTNGASTAGGRTNKWEKSIIQMFKEPLGWDLKEFGFSHNLWFDATRVGGLLSFFLLILFTLSTVKQILKLYRLNQQPKLLDGQLLLYCTSFFLSFFVEPILEGYFILFSLFCLVLGVLSSYVEVSNTEKTAIAVEDV